MKRYVACLLVVCGCSGSSVSHPEGHDAGTEAFEDAATDAPDLQSRDDFGGDAPDVGADVSEAALVPGLTAEYFAQYRVPALTRVEPSIDHVWGDGAPDSSVPADFFSARWSGFLRVPESGSYAFHATVDDGMRLWVNGDLVIDAWTWQFPTEYDGTIELEAGDSSFMVEYMERDLTAQIQVGWSSANFEERLLGEGDFQTTGSPSRLAAPKSPYLNPVVPFDCPDPGVNRDPVDGAFYAICTGGPFHIRRSYDLIFWEDTGADVFADGKPAWAANGRRNWAPEIHKVGEKWLVYYTSVNGSDVLSIGVASADAPTGPYVDRGSPLVERAAGVIDANYFVDDDGKHYLSYKIDGNAQGNPTPIFIRELAPDGLSFAAGSQETEILRNATSTWEGGVVEAQWMIKRNGTYFLFYSGNVYDNRYRTGVARSSSVTGPFEKFGPPILANNASWVGPGHGSIFRVGSDWVFVYHAWHNAGGGAHDTSQGRNILVDRIVWENNWPTISNGTPSTTPQPAFETE